MVKGNIAAGALLLLLGVWITVAQGMRGGGCDSRRSRTVFVIFKSNHRFCADFTSMQVQ